MTQGQDWRNSPITLEQIATVQVRRDAALFGAQGDIGMNGKLKEISTELAGMRRALGYMQNMDARLKSIESSLSTNKDTRESRWNTFINTAIRWGTNTTLIGGAFLVGKYLSSLGL